MVRQLLKSIFGIKDLEDIQAECLIKPEYAYSFAKKTTKKTKKPKK
tara:strand:- start:422 stop:559 length:138 start_codon:yes stop_codon:yes gene_type:complete